MLVDTRRGGGATGCEEGETEDGIEYYRLRSFSITANGVNNLGDLLKTRRSRSINSVTSSTSCCSSTRESRLLSSASQLSGIEAEEEADGERVTTYKVGMLGASEVGKTALTAQFTTSDYICAYDASLVASYVSLTFYARGFHSHLELHYISLCFRGTNNKTLSFVKQLLRYDEYGQKNVSVMLDGQETELEIIDHPAAEMSVETFCSTYNPDVYVVVYSVVDRRSLKVAEETLLYLWKSDYMVNHGVILVGNKVDLERKREVPSMVGRRLANSCGCKFIETSSGLAHHVDELLVGILAQIKLNPQRSRDQATRRRRSKHRRRILKHLLGFKRKTKSCENLFVL
ncbi:GTP-binding protein REM 1 [Trachymyrmex septentrionalis]|uniref:GTP-binding protein REM 1 n=1 Tax=Trachymyrmex septentrionalis TaxID=34720 RepID=A0A195EWN3_9HYME|nr:GTP-binding protein REM 1 [Trachymyrmex septentrionalis]